MPRITLLRLLLLIPLSWLLLFIVFISLPSPRHSWDKYPSHRWRGGTLTRVYDIDDWWQVNERNSNVRYVRGTGANSFALDLHYDADAGSLVLGWEEAAGIPEARFQLTPEPEPEPFVSVPFLARVRLGVQDGINMPWFAKADATLLSFEVDHRTGYLPLRLQAKKSRGEGEIMPMFYSIESANYTEWEAPDWNTPLLRLLVMYDQSSARPNPAAGVHIEFPTEDSSWSPSLTFPLRRAIGKVLIPTGKFAAEVMAILATATRVLYVLVVATFKAFIFTLGLYVVLVLACWKSKGSPPFWPWARSFWLTRRVVRYVGPAAASCPLGDAISGADHDHDHDHDHGSHDTVNPDDAPRTPQPLTSIWGFFTSKSPLDDLLVTFQATKPFVEPLSLRWRRRPAPIDDEEKKTPAASSGVAEDSNGDTTRSRNTSFHETKNGEKEMSEEKVPV
ncbi:uncharacterized protein A1O9_08310 [Exophiala aquamarina CBS 119918]|uniref:Uncharacterized protein n=1 Tax=Exophiala aquamarina CBS 119918 TaxID=1182545 RepID=A0A072PJ46_9EURO|nr:uncharacterized protein A1O9_08310 [Exophiala aquamarina CBS 119918]KEF55560.1 hypothetical protein A1O9_08310 [Exophiala aquamarina CBS 119918]